MSDAELLARYVGEGSEEAFVELVGRHRDWVYSVCKRRVGDGGLAEDATQAVFLALWQQARKLRQGGTIVGWLHQVSRYTAAKLRRDEGRRRERERGAALMRSEEVGDTARVWGEVEGVLEEAMDGLRAADREAVLLRFYRKLSHAEVGTALGISEEAAKKRVNRAVERLRGAFGEGGAGVSGAGIGAALMAHGVGAAPHGMELRPGLLSESARVRALAGGARGAGAAVAMLPVAVLAGVAVVGIAVPVMWVGRSEKVATMTAAPVSAPSTTAADGESPRSDVWRLKWVLLACCAWGNSHGNNLPDNLATVMFWEQDDTGKFNLLPGDLVVTGSGTAPLEVTAEMGQKGKGDPELFAKEVAAHCDWVYLGKGMPSAALDGRLTNVEAIKLVVLCEKLEVAVGDHVYVGFADGRVETHRISELRQLFAETNAVRKAHGVAEVDVEAMLRRREGE